MGMLHSPLDAHDRQRPLSLLRQVLLLAGAVRNAAPAFVDKTFSGKHALHERTVLRWDTGEVDSRTTSSGSTIMRRAELRPAGAVMLLRTVSAASRPMLRNGWRTVVRAGF